MNLASRIIVCSGLTLVSCATPKAITDYQRDSVVVEIKESVILKDSVVLVKVPMERDKSVVYSTDTSRLETSVARSEAYVIDGQLHHFLANKETLLPIKVTLPMTVYCEKRESALIHKLAEIVEVEKELSRWQRFIQALGYGLLLACVLWLANKIRKIVV